MLSPDWLPATFSKVLHKRREALGISQEELSKRSGLHRTYISDVERGARNVSLKNMGRLSAALEVQPSVLIRWAELIYAGEVVDFSTASLRQELRFVIEHNNGKSESALLAIDVPEPSFAMEEAH